MSFELVDIFPNASQGLSNIGFIFGAGASYKAGYPLMPELTVKVIEKLSASEADLLDDLVSKAHGTKIDRAKGEPNIELISDLLESALFTIDRAEPQYNSMQQARASIREKIVDVMLSTMKPKLDDHVRFFTALNCIFSGRSETIWIFTPNYDLLFELGAAVAKAPLNNGFLGASFGYFNVQSLGLSIGTVDSAKFSPLSQPVFRLVKLHGSLDWWRDKALQTSIYSTQTPTQVNVDLERVIVLPRKRKITETLDMPFGDIFRLSEKIIGSQCKYLVSCGYGYGDEHINSTLLLPKVQQGKIRLTALVKDHTTNLDEFRNLAAFSFGTTSSLKKNGSLLTVGTDLWQFDKFVNLLCNHAGM